MSGIRSGSAFEACEGHMTLHAQYISKEQKKRFTENPQSFAGRPMEQPQTRSFRGFGNQSGTGADEAFLSLLNSQRWMLSRMGNEKASEDNARSNQDSKKRKFESRGDFGLSSSIRGRPTTTNTPITDNSALDYIIEKRRSIGLGSSEHINSLLANSRSFNGMGTTGREKFSALNNPTAGETSGPGQYKSSFKRTSALKRDSIGLGASEHIRADLFTKRGSIGLGASEHIRADLHSTRRASIGLGASVHIKSDLGLGASEHIREYFPSRRASIGLGASEHVRADFSNSRASSELRATEHSQFAAPQLVRGLSLGASEHMHADVLSKYPHLNYQLVDRADISLTEHTISQLAGSMHNIIDDEFLQSRSVRRRLDEFGASLLEGLTTHHTRQGSQLQEGNFSLRAMGPLLSLHKATVHADPDSDDESGCEEDEFGMETHEVEEPSPRVDPREARLVMEAFTKSMEISQKTQQDIHDWDRKMGLKRSHSKTMRLSSRSRKKLRSIMKKEMNALAAKM